MPACIMKKEIAASLRNVCRATTGLREVSHLMSQTLDIFNYGCFPCLFVLFPRLFCLLYYILIFNYVFTSGHS